MTDPEQLEHAHDHAHEHEHGHAHGHHHFSPSDWAGLRPAFAIGIALNLAFVGLEVAFGLSSHSLALVADAGHNFGDVICLILGGGAVMLAQRSPSPQFTYGLRGSTILAALGNSVILLVVTGGIIWASVDRLRALTPVAADTVIAVAALGVVINGATAFFFASARHQDLNARGAYLHMAGDAAVSLGVIAAALVMHYTGWIWLDPVVSIVIALVILYSTWDLLRQSLRLAVQAVPASIDPGAVRQFLESQKGVIQTHDLHIWAMSTTETAMTAHIVMPAGHPGDHFLDDVARELDRRFKVGHVTLQVETGEGGQVCCALACEEMSSSASMHSI
ncbi:MAG: cation diffusion facilitator family transporter [Burkholderiaceae bacterium]|jgi:cobalt-zinc-cadmium efflux system protein